MPSEPNWQAAEQALVDASLIALRCFEKEHSEVVCSFFAISIDYPYGDATICFDWVQNSLEQSQRYHDSVVEHRRYMLSQPRGWEDAAYWIQQMQIVNHTPNTAEFTYPDFASVHFDDWEPYFMGEELPDVPDHAGKVIVLAHKVVDRLVDSQAFSRLNVSSPFHIGCEFPQDIALTIFHTLRVLL